MLFKLYNQYYGKIRIEDIANWLKDLSDEEIDTILRSNNQL